jgi:large exoprotein involved in heme utilization and adhesion
LINLFWLASLVGAGIRRGNDNALENRAGDITIYATEHLQVIGGSNIQNSVDANASGQTGDITITVGKLIVQDGSLIGTVILGNGRAGNVRVKTDSIALDGTAINAAPSGISSQVLGNGTGGDVIVKTNSLTVRNGAAISASIGGNGKAGNVFINAKTIDVEGVAFNGASSGIVSDVLSQGSNKGSGGNVTIEADALNLTRGGVISASTSGNGDAGSVGVKANIIFIDGNAGASGIVSEVLSAGNGRGGNVSIDTTVVNVINGAKISTTTRGIGDAGNVQVTGKILILNGTMPDSLSPSSISSGVGVFARGTGGNVLVDAHSISITDGANISVTSLGTGDAGDILITANDITIDGIKPNNIASGIGSQIVFPARGNGGDIRIKTDSLSISNGGTISASALGEGNAGNLDISARNLQLNQSTITARAFSGDGANIDFTIGELLLMRNGSAISTSAGLAQAGGDGGNITIAAPRGFVVGVKTENNDITANAFTGNGGRINITAQGVYGLQFRPQLTEFSDITASSTFGLSGTVSLNILGVDPTRSLFVLPANPLDPRMQLDDRCKFGGRFSRSSFIYTGRGGFPTDPADILRDEESQLQDTDWIEWGEKAEGGRGKRGKTEDRRQETGVRREGAGGREQGEEEGAKGEDSTSSTSPPSPSSPTSPSSLPSPIIEATGWIQTPDGRVFLVADAPNGGLQGPWLPMLDCIIRRQSQAPHGVTASGYEPPTPNSAAIER